MKTFFTIIFVLFSTLLFSQEQIGLPGDNLNLYAVLGLFQKSPTLEQFERDLNNPDNKINNLDLNGDGQTDYIHVTDHVISSSHMIALQIYVSQTEKQDVAVIEVGRVNGDVRVQVIGDEELYGKDYIVEPQASTPNPAYTDNIGSSNVSVSNDVATWAIINWMFLPTYTVYASPYYYGYYPYYWHPWHPVYYNEYYGWHSHYYGNPYYRRNNYYYYPTAHGLYAPHRTVSPYVHRTYYNNYHPQNHPVYHPQNQYNHINNGYHPSQPPMNHPSQPMNRPTQTQPNYHPNHFQPAPSSPRPSSPRPSSPPTRTSTPSYHPSPTRTSSPTHYSSPSTHHR